MPFQKKEIENTILETTAIELDLEPIRDIVLEIEGINSTKRINSKVYWVPLVDVRKKVHYVKCYSLEKITEDSQPINPEIYHKICKKVKVDPGRVPRPVTIDVLLSTRNNYLMSNKMRVKAGTLQLYSGLLGETVSGTSNLLTNEHIKSYPNKATPVISSVKKAKVIEMEKVGNNQKLAESETKLERDKAKTVMLEICSHQERAAAAESEVVVLQKQEKEVMQLADDSTIVKAMIKKESFNNNTFAGPESKWHYVASSKPVSDLHILDTVILESESLKKIDYVTALLSRLRGRVGVKLKFHKFDPKDKADSNPVTAAEHDDAMKFKVGPVQFDPGDNHVYIILAKKTVEIFHKNYHRDDDAVVTHIRAEFWIPGVRRMMSQVDKHCRVYLEWKFVMAASQHQKKVTETMVEIVKGVMNSLVLAIGTTLLFYNELNTLKETQNLVNEWPFGLKSKRQTDIEYLSLKSLLLGSRSDRISSDHFQVKADFTRDPGSDKTRFLPVQKISNQFWRVSEVMPDEQGFVRNVKVEMLRSQPDRSNKYRLGAAGSEVNKHVFMAKEEIGNDESGEGDENIAEFGKPGE